MKKHVLFLLISGILSLPASASMNDSIPADTLGWKLKGQFGFNFSQVHLSNWNAGGQSSMALLSFAGAQLFYKAVDWSWDNQADLAYGILRPGPGTLLKTDDRIELSSKYGRHAFKKYYYSALAAFRTQFAPGYNYPDDSNKISEFMAPGYLMLSLGLDYQPNENFSVMLSPLSGKITFVMDEELANAGAFGVTPARYENGVLVEEGEKIRKEFGAYLKSTLTRQLAENITFKTRLDLFSNYLDRPENIDVNWETLLVMKVNKYINVNIGTFLVYDHDIDIAIDDNDDGTVDRTGPRIQFKEILSAGLLYQF